MVPRSVPPLRRTRRVLGRTDRSGAGRCRKELVRQRNGLAGEGGGKGDDGMSDGPSMHPEPAPAPPDRGSHAATSSLHTATRSPAPTRCPRRNPPASSGSTDPAPPMDASACLTLRSSACTTPQPSRRSRSRRAACPATLRNGTHRLAPSEGTDAAAAPCVDPSPFCPWMTSSSRWRSPPSPARPFWPQPVQNESVRCGVRDPLVVVARRASRDPVAEGPLACFPDEPKGSTMDMWNGMAFAGGEP